MADKLSRLLATFFYVGYFPVASGTVASAVGLLIYVILKDNIWLYGLVTILVTVLGFLVSTRAEKTFAKHDPGEIVIDEVAGVLIALFLFPFKFPLAILAFFIFRGLDMVKPPPADRLERLPGSLGIMLDDIVAAVYTNLVFQIVFLVVSRKYF